MPRPAFSSAFYPLRRLFTALVLVCLPLLAAGCGPTLQMRVEALGGAHMEQNYAILPGQADTRPGDLFFEEYKSRLAGVLRSLGYRVTEDAKDASAAVLLSFSGSEEDPAYYYAPSGPRVGVGMGSGYPYGSGWGGSVFGVGVGFPLGNSAPPPPRHRYRIGLDAVTLGKDGTPQDGKSLWEVRLNATGGDGDQRAAFAAMLDAARPYIGRDSKGTVNLTVDLP